MELSEHQWKEKTELAIAEINTVQIVDASTYAHVANLVMLCRQAEKYFEQLYRPRIQEANKLADGLRNDMRALQEPARTAVRFGERAMMDWRAAEQRKADEAAFKLRADQQKKRDEEKAALAEAAAEAGDTELAQTILEEHVEPAPIVIKPDIPKIEGLSVREDWDFEVTDWKQIPARFHRMEQNAKGEWSCKAPQDIGAEVRRMKQTANIPGVRAYKVETTVKKV